MLACANQYLRPLMQRTSYAAVSGWRARHVAAHAIAFVRRFAWYNSSRKKQRDCHVNVTEMPPMDKIPGSKT